MELAQRIALRTAFYDLDELVEVGPIQKGLDDPQQEDNRQSLDGIFG